MIHTTKLREWPKEAIETLPDGYTILGWGGEFDIVGKHRTYDCAICWDCKIDWIVDDFAWDVRVSSQFFAAPTDSEIVELNLTKGLIKPTTSLGDLIDESAFEDQAGTEHLLSSDDTLRQQYRPLDWLLEYFPNAQLQCAKFSYDNNLKHTGEEGMVWQMEKSVGDGNQLSRHLLEGMHYARTGNDKEALYHLTAVAWRGLELLERYMTEMEPFNESR